MPPAGPSGGAAHRSTWMVRLIVVLICLGSAWSVGVPPAAARVATLTVPNPTLLYDTFDNGRADGWLTRDMGTTDGPSRWHVVGGAYQQSSNVYGGSTGADAAKPGTVAAIGNNAWSDYDYSVRARSYDNDALGIIFRYTDKDNYYRFSMDSQRRYRRLIKVVGGKVSTLWQSTTYGYAPGYWYGLRAVAVGTHLQILVNSTLVVDVVDSSLRSGRPGLYTWGDPTTFDDMTLAYSVGAGQSFTVAVVPDIQNETQYAPAQLAAQMSWLAAARGIRNIVDVLQEGDLVNLMSDPKQWQTAKTYLSYLDGKVPFAVAAGNHDILDYGHDSAPYPAKTQQFNALLDGMTDYPVSGYYVDGDNTNTYQLIDAGGVAMVVLNLVFGAPDDVLAWAGAIADRYVDKHVLLLTHDYLGPDNTWRGSVPLDLYLPTSYNPDWNNGVEIWNAFVRVHPNVQFTFNGHDITPTPGRVG